MFNEREYKKRGLNRVFQGYSFDHFDLLVYESPIMCSKLKRMEEYFIFFLESILGM